MIYVASSWRNPIQIAVVKAIQAAGLEVYDFKDSAGFKWQEVMSDYTPGVEGIPKSEPGVSLDSYLKALQHPRARQGYIRDFFHMDKCHTCVMVLPCGNSAHLELGWCVGQGKRTAILMTDPVVPDLMYGMVDYLAPSLFDLLGWLGVVD